MLNRTTFIVCLVAALFVGWLVGYDPNNFDCERERSVVQDEFGQCIEMADFIRYTNMPGVYLNADGESLTIDCSLQDCVNQSAGNER